MRLWFDFLSSIIISSLNISSALFSLSLYFLIPSVPPVFALTLSTSLPPFSSSSLLLFLPSPLPLFSSFSAWDY
jgi:hypothetical protein